MEWLRFMDENLNTSLNPSSTFSISAFQRFSVSASPSSPSASSSTSPDFWFTHAMNKV
jgi:hypothetical protein